MTDTPGYKTMYAAYLAEIYAEDRTKMAASLAIANQEIVNRPTSQSYDLQAWALLNMGNQKEALSIIENFVDGRTSEPIALYHSGMIYLANNKLENAKKNLEEAKASSFELGPVVTSRIQKALQKI
jgi:tetratricopeptide (TPR) repeat protein